MGDFPMPGLADLRDKYTYLGSELTNVASLAGMFPPSPQRTPNLLRFTGINCLKVKKCKDGRFV